MRVTVVGCSGSFPGPASAASCYLVQADGVDARGQAKVWSLLLDLGSGALGPLQSYIDLEQIDGVALSHLHPDHCLDLCGLYVYLKYHPRGPVASRPLLFGPAGSAKRLARAYDLPLVPGMHDEVDVYAFAAEQQVSVGPFTLTPYPVRHPVPAYAIRVTGPKEDGEGSGVLAYSGDTDECPGLVDAARGADLFVCEAAFEEGRDQPAGVHLTGRKAGMAANEAGVGSLVLTHIPPWNDPGRARDEARQVWSGPLELASPGLMLTI